MAMSMSDKVDFSSKKAYEWQRTLYIDKRFNTSREYKNCKHTQQNTEIYEAKTDKIKRKNRQ